MTDVLLDLARLTQARDPLAAVKAAFDDAAWIAGVAGVAGGIYSSPRNPLYWPFGRP